MHRSIIARSPQTEQFDWGEITWFANGAIGNSKELTLGRCVIRPGMSNTLHEHPNTSEVLTVVSGTILHTTETGEVELRAGDTITLPAGLPHRARNVGDCDAVLFIAYPTAYREFVVPQQSAAV
ncbi:MAG TPA: cupin domain-containing protein [Polyangiaceae bacterium]|jgi:quercetin dioxygenase-like cupin family protein